MTTARPPLSVLNGRFVTLEPLTDNHLPELFEAIAHPQVFAGGYGGGPAGLPATLTEFCAFARAYYPFGAGNPYAIRLRGGAHDGVLVGTSTLGDFELADEAAHIGWTAYDPRVWGTAVNPEAKLLLLGLAFDSGFGRVKIQADAANERSRAAILRLGATLEGILRHERRRADGSWRDTAIYSILVEEWPEVRQALEARIAAQGERPVLYRGVP
ncbi:GNAT family N-acetyltransferase [Salinibacterium hongtaonis]|uniref:GNAT family N-acetyltransferase n=1 Tax=Homoserinimonas hongtaonis TaxID=2079791 RepID=UPI000D34F016|nr:GNAT family protein [Salinibacterium hongtaonis]AWB90228.1 N-acetyltransferase [Salinibacterium hongtaonis]